MPNLGIARLQVEYRHGRSCVVEQYSQAPLQLHRPLYLAAANHPCVFLKTPSAGLLEGDEHRIEVRVGTASSLEMRTQAATLVYPGKSKLDLEIDLADDGTFVFLPHSYILAKGANFSQLIRIRMKGSSRLRFSDTWSAGRLAMKEKFEFESFRSSIEIVVDDKLVHRENWILAPSTMPFEHPMLCGGNTRFSNLYEFGRRPLPELAQNEQTHGALAWSVSRPEGAIHRSVWAL